MRQQERPTIEFRSIRERPRRRRRALKVAAVIGLALAALVGGTALYLWNYVNAKFRETHRVLKVDPLPAGQAQNILVLGSDRRDVVERGQRGRRQFRGGSGNRADTILLVHVPPDHNSAVVLSFPRDLRVRIPGRSGFSKINAAYGGGTVNGKRLGGPDLMMETIRRHTGLPIHHYVEINFASFQRIVDAVGGVRLCTDRDYDDEESGLIVKRGCRIYDGELALAYVRMRKQDPRGDFGRIERQQQFMRVLMSKITSVGVLTDPFTITKLADAISKGVITDDRLDLSEVRGIANKLADFKQSNVDFRVVPSYPDYIGGVSYVIQRNREARALYRALRDDTALPPFGKTGASIPQRGDVTVTVLNGTGTPGLAARIAEQLEALGYVVTEVANADRRDYRTTTILYRFGAEAKAQLVEDDFRRRFAEAAVRQGSPRQRVDIVIVLGADAVPSPAPASG